MVSSINRILDDSPCQLFEILLMQPDYLRGPKSGGLANILPIEEENLRSDSILFCIVHSEIL